MFTEMYIPGAEADADNPGRSYRQGSVYNALTLDGGERMRFDPGLRRPYFDKHGKPSVTVNTGRWTLDKGVRVPIKEHRYVADLVNNFGMTDLIGNATSLRKEEWLELDRKVLLAARYRLRAVDDLKSKVPVYGINGMSKLILEHETMTDPGHAVMDMDGLTESSTDSPRYQLEGLPLNITHSDFWYDSRRLAASRNSSQPLDMVSGEAAGRRIGEMLEGVTIGTRTGVVYGGNSTQTGGYGRTSQVYGYLNFPSRLTKTNLTTPTTTNQATTLAEVLAMRDQQTAQKFFGPWVIYTSNDWDRWLDNDYILVGGNVATQTLRERLKAIEGITDVRRLDMLFGVQPQTNPYWTSSTVGTTGKLAYTGPGGNTDITLKPYTLIMVQQTEDVCRWVNGMDITTVQWETVGGMRLNFKVLCIQVPQLRADNYGNCGLLVATTS